MPIYEFICTSCGQQFQTICSLAETAKVTCTACQSPAVKKILSSGSIKIGGNGATTSSLASAPKSCGNSGFS